MKVSQFSCLLPIHQNIVIGIIIDVAHHRLYKPVLNNSYTPEKRKFVNRHFANKELDAINIANIFHYKSVQANVPAYFKQQAEPIISYTYTSTIVSKMFNHRKTLQHLNIDDPRLTPPICYCSSSSFNYNLIGHVITGNLAIVTNGKLRNTPCKGPKNREPQHINWNQTFKLLMDSVEDYADILQNLLNAPPGHCRSS